jgi:hypothetical protein
MKYGERHERARRKRAAKRAKANRDRNRAIGMAAKRFLGRRESDHENVNSR